MKTNHCFKLNRSARAAMRAGLLILAALLAGNYVTLAQDQATPPTNAIPQVATNTPAAESQTATAGQTDQSATPASGVVETVAKAGSASSNGIELNFHGAQIDQVLDYLSKAAGFIIVYDTPVSGRVSIVGHNLTKDEAYELINTELVKNGYGAVRVPPRTLRIMTEAAIKLKNPIKTFNGRLEDIPNNEEIATWIIPIRYVEAQQLISDISPFVSSGATIVANVAGNSVIITDTQSNTKHLVEIISAIDSSAEEVTEVKVFPLKYADPNETATLLSGLFPDQTGATAPIQINRGGRGGRGGFGGGRGGAFGGGFNPFAAAFGANQGGGQADRIRQRKQVVAVADPRTSSVVVTATSDLIVKIGEMIDVLDHPGKHVSMAVVPLINGNPYDIMQALQDTIGASTTRNTQNQQRDQLTQRITTFQNQYGSSSSMTSSGLGSGGRGARGQ